MAEPTQTPSPTSEGEKVLRERHIIDTFKGLTASLVLFLIALTHGWDRLDLWLYFVIHGSYGALWVAKSKVFPDPNWERPVRGLRTLLLPIGLLAYWVAPIQLAVGAERTGIFTLIPPLLLYVFGVFLHFASDMQKHMHLKCRPGTLLCDGLWARTRNPNYLGEFLIYLSFCLLAGHWLPFLIFGGIIAMEWIPNIRRKEKSLSRYPEFAAWKARSGLLFPKVI